MSHADCTAGREPRSVAASAFYKRSLKFLRSCLTPCTFVANFIALHGVSSSRMFSCLGRNVQFCSERYGRQVGDMMTANVSLSFISERELTFTFAICYRPSVRLSVCLSSLTLVHPTQAVKIFGNISTALGTLAIR